MCKQSSLAFATLTLQLCQLLSGLESARILAVLGIPNPAENIFGATLLNALNARGHDITVIIRFSHDMKLHENIRKITIDENGEIFKDFLSISAENFDKTLFSNVQKFYGKSASLTAKVLKNLQVRPIIEQNQYDLIMIDALMSEGLCGLGEYFGAPMISVSNFFYTHNLDALTGNYSPLSTVPHILVQHSFEGRFLQRFLNVAIHIFDKLGYGFCNLPHQRQVYKELFPNASLSFDQAQSNFSLVLLNQHFSLSFPRPFLPNMVEVAGLHIEDSVALPLPFEVQKFLDTADEGVIYVFLSIDAKTLDIKFHRYLMLKLFYALKDMHYKVVWHNDFVPAEVDIYSNILQVSNISQQSLLAHPHVKLYITNGEIEGLIEAVYFAKPILGLPHFAHQHININMAIASGYGLGIKYRNLCEAKLRNAIWELLNNSTYFEKVQQLSKIFHDQPMKPKEKAIYWIEYVLRHSGAVHMMSKVRSLNIWQLQNIDVFLAYFAIFSLLVVWVSLAMKCFYVVINKIKNFFAIKLKRS